MLWQDIAGTVRISTNFEAHAAATATEILSLLDIPYNCRVFEVGVRVATAVTGANTNSSNLNVLNGGTGAGTTELGNVDFLSGTNASAGVDYPIYTSTAGLAMSQGNVLKLQAEKVGTGLDIPRGVFYAKIRGAVA